MDVTTIALRIVVLFTLIAIVSLCVMAFWKRTVDRLLVVPPLTWALFGMALYAAALTGSLSQRSAMFWISGFWLSTCFLVLGGTWMFLWPGRRKK